MQSFNWVDIDGIRYSWDGQDNIVCSGRFGYQAAMTGDKLNGLELESEDGDVAGLLNVDFAASSISFTPALTGPRRCGRSWSTMCTRCGTSCRC